MRIIESLIEKIRLRLLLRNQFESLALRRHFRKRYGIEIGLYSYGCFDRWRVPPGTTIGRYCSFAATARLVDTNHPLGSLSTHPFFYAPDAGVISENVLDTRLKVIEDDVWIGHHAIIATSCQHIGRGAVIGAGSVVTHDVPRYAVVAGVPAKIMRYRFPPDVVAAIEASSWWTLDKDELRDLARKNRDAIFRPSAETLAALALATNGVSRARPRIGGGGLRRLATLRRRPS